MLQQGAQDRKATVKKKEVTDTGQQPAENMVTKEAVTGPRGHSLMKGHNSQTESGSVRKLHRSKDITTQQLRCHSNEWCARENYKLCSKK